MIYIKIEDIKTLKFQSIIDDISTDNEVINEIEAMAIDEIIAYISGAYDTDYIFYSGKAKQSPLLKRIIIDIMLYLLFQRVSGNNIPEYIIETYDKDIEFLKGIAKGLFNPVLPKLDPKSQNTIGIKYGSETKVID